MKRVVYDIFPAVLAALDLGVLLSAKQLGYNLLFDHDHCWRELFTLKEPQ